MHLDESALRRSIDEPDSLEAKGRTHLEACAACGALREELEQNALFAQGLLARSAPAFDAQTRVPRAELRRRRPAWLAPATALAAAAAVVFALAFTPLGGTASQWLTIFEPKQFVPLEITAKDSEQLRLMPNLQRLGTFTVAKPPPRRPVTSLSGIGRTLGFEPRSFDGALHGRRPGPAFVQMPFSTSFTFSAAKARAYEAKFNRSLPPMPGGLDGTTYTATYGPTLERTFGQDADRVAFVETKAPRLVSTGASLETTANYILALPNVPPGVAAQLRAIADPAHTLPIPFAFDKGTATPVTVDGVSGLAIGDESRFGSAVFWLKNGVVYVVAGRMRESEAIALADSVSSPAIEVAGIAKRFGDTIAVADLSLRVERGSIFGFLGPNGAGKTTSVKMLLGLVSPSAGSGKVLGAPIGDRATRARIGYLPELFRFQEWLTAREVLTLHATLAEIAPAARSNEVDRVLEIAGLTERCNDRVGAYSKGMQQRLGLGAALLGEPELVFLDEPTSALDPVGRRDVRDLLRTLASRGTTVFLNSHLLTEVEKVCDRVAIVRAGRVVANGTPAEIAGAQLGVRVRAIANGVTLRQSLSAFGDVIEEEGGAFVRGVGNDRVPDVVAALVAAGARVYAVSPVSQSLEERFLEMMSAP